jgi:hypothetical protein
MSQSREPRAKLQLPNKAPVQAPNQGRAMGGHQGGAEIWDLELLWSLVLGLELWCARIPSNSEDLSSLKWLFTYNSFATSSLP